MLMNMAKCLYLLSLKSWFKNEQYFTLFGWLKDLKVVHCLKQMYVT